MEICTHPVVYSSQDVFYDRYTYVCVCVCVCILYPCYIYIVQEMESVHAALNYVQL